MSLRRDLKFTTLDEVLGELNRLNESDVQTVGKWSYYQILDHIANAVNCSMNGYPRLLPGFIRKTVGSLAFRHMMKSGYMKEGVSNPSAPKQREEGDSKEAANRLKSAISRFKTFDGPMAEHPFFGRLTKQDYFTLHSYHAALHLGFAHPDESVTHTAAGFMRTERSRPGERKQAGGSRTGASNRTGAGSARTTTTNAAGKKTKKSATIARKTVGTSKKASKKGKR